MPDVEHGFRLVHFGRAWASLSPKRRAFFRRINGMTRACYALTCLLAILTVPSLAQSPTNSRAYCLGDSYLETCPFVDGYHDTYGEDLSSVPAEEATDETDLSGRSFVAILEDPVAESPALGEVAPTESLSHSPCPVEAYMPQAAVATPAATDSEPAAAGPANEYEYPYGWRTYDYSYHSYHGSDFAYEGCGSSSTTPTTPAVADVSETDLTQIETRDYEKECYEAWLQLRAAEASQAAAVAEQPMLVTENEPFDAYGYEYRYGCCPEEYSAATSEVESTEVEVYTTEPQAAVVPEPMTEVTSDSVAEQALDVAVETTAEAVAEPAPWEPYGYEDGYSDPNGLYEEGESLEAQTEAEEESVELAPQSSYEVYDYYHGSPTPTESEPQPADEPAPSVPLYHGRYPYGYGYEYDYEYSHEYSPATPAEEPTAVDNTDNVEEAALDVMQWVDLGRDFLSRVGDSDLLDQVRAEAEGIISQVASVIETLPLEQIGADVTYAMTEAIQQPAVTEPQDDANVFLFAFESDLNAEPLLEAELPQNPWVVEAQVISEPQPATIDSMHTETAVETPVSAVPAINSDQVRQWTRRALDVAVAAWDRLAQEWDRVAARSVATLSGDESLNTQR
jgi:hypothetical protein